MYAKNIVLKTVDNKSDLSNGTSFRVVPISLLYFYPLLVTADLVLTYLSTPDLHYESNVIIKYFDLSWLQIVVGVITLVISIILLTIKADIVLSKTYDQNKNRTNIHKLIFLIIIVFFYAHLFSSMFVVVNNYLSYIYLHGRSDFALKEMSVNYVHFYQQNNSWYHVCVYAILSLVGFLVSIFRVRKKKMLMC